jgi:hypothetical protein
MNVAALALEGGTCLIDPNQDVNETASIVLHAKRSGGESAVARIIRDDDALPVAVRRMVEVGIVLDLMPDHLTPRRDVLARRLGCTVKTVRRKELAWEGIDRRVRFVLVHRASRLVIALRAAIM